jgi:hypothetical protein
MGVKLTITKGGTQSKVFENRVLKRIFGPKKEEVTGGWRRLHYEEVHNCKLHQMLLELSNQGGFYVLR